MSKTVFINLWDDYHQKPQHDWNDTTYLTIEYVKDGEETSHDMSIRDKFLIREDLLKMCNDWKRSSLKQRFNKVRFSRDMREEKLDIIDLDEKSRESLYDYLKKHFTESNGYKIQMTMES